MNDSHVSSCGIRFSKNYNRECPTRILQLPYTSSLRGSCSTLTRSKLTLKALSLYRLEFLVAKCARFEINQTLARTRSNLSSKARTQCVISDRTN
jgi:hypothetical protein